MKNKMESFLKNSNKATFPVGFHNFYEMIMNTNIFVDKTLFIK